MLQESPRPERVRRHPRAAWLVVATVAIGAFMGQLDATIVTLALPRIGRAFGVARGVAVWVSLAYLLVLVCGLPVAGYLADRLGRKRLYVQGFAVFTAASIACGLAPSLPLLVAARVLQGAGAALLQANSVALIRESLPAADLRRGLGIQGAAQATGLALGPAAGGLLLALGGWRLVFLASVPAGAAGLIAGVLLLPRSRTHRRDEPFDAAGVALLALAVGGPLLALSLGTRWGVAAPMLLALAGLLAAGGLIAAERCARAPLLDLALLSRAPFPAALGAGALAQAALFAALVALPFALAARHVGPATVGVELAALPVALALCAPLAARMPARAAGGGLALAGAALVVASLGGPPPLLVGALALAGAGLGAFVPANNASVMGAAPAGRTAAIGGMLNMTRGVGTAAGIAIAGLGGALLTTLAPFGAAAALAGAALAATARDPII